MKQTLLSTTELDTNLEAYLEGVQVRADKIVDKFIISFFLLGLCFAPIYDTWSFSLITGGLTVVLYLIARFAIKQKFYARMIVSAVFAVFVLQFIGQMHGMAEIHFFFFTNIGILVIYQDWRIMAPYTILTVAHHGILAFFQWYLKAEELGQYFISYTDITPMQLGFHFGIVALMGVICGISAYFFRENSIKAYQAQVLVEQQNEELQTAQENLQKTLSEINGQFSAIDATVGYVELSPDRKIIKANDIFCNIIGYEKSEMAQIPHTQLISKEYAQSENYELFWRELLQGKIQTCEFERINKGGESVWIYATYSPMLDKKGQVTKIIKLASDITTQKQQQEEIKRTNQELEANQEELKQNLEELQAIQEHLLKVQADEQKSNEVFKALFEFSSNAHLIFDATGIIDCNQAAMDILGYESKNAILNLHPAQLSPKIQSDGRNSDEKSQEMDRMAKEKGFHRFEWTHQRANGENFPVEVTLTPIKLSDRQVLLVVWNDLTEIKQKEYLLQINNAELEAQFKAIDSSMSYIEFNTNRQVIKANKLVCELLGYSETEIKGIEHSIFVPKEYKTSKAYEDFWQQLLQGHSFTQEFERVTKQGNTIWIYASYSPVLDTKGKVVKIVKLAVDITEDKKLAEEIKLKNAALASSEKEIRQNFEELSATQEQLKTQFDILAVKNKNIADSIRYAKRIQDALLPRLTEIQGIFPESFVFFKPRDIISGDFYWFANKDSEQIIVAADCTGHGVPGAFMSMLGSSLLNQIVHDKEIHEPNLILDLLHNGVEDMLNQRLSDSESRDGMDAAICLINQEKQIVQFAGANNPMYVVTKKALDFIIIPESDTLKITESGEWQLTEIKGDKKPIGGRASKHDKLNYVSQTFKIDQELHIYLFSDGIIDQIGGEKRMKLMSKGFKQVILESHENPANGQNQFFDDFFADWTSSTQKQLDDVLVIGLKVAHEV